MTYQEIYEEVKRRLAAIRGQTHDDEAAHALEDELFVWLLQTLTRDDVEISPIRLRLLCQLTLVTCSYKFHRLRA